MKKTIWITIAVLVVLVALPLSSQAAPLKNISWWAEYFDNPSLSGRPVLTRYEETMNHDWGKCSPAPEVPCDNFSARWTITRHFEEGTYLFLLTVDDGARVWLDGELIIDAWNIGKLERKARIQIEETGDHEIQVAYFEKTGLAFINLEWILLGGEDDIVGAWQGEYFNNRDLEGDPVLVRWDGDVNFDWNSGSPSPLVPRDNFSVRWTRSSYIEPGYYIFRIQHDDGMRIYVDGKIIYDSWFDQSVGYFVRKVHLKGGYRTFVVEYYEHTGNAVAFVKSEPDTGGDYGEYEPDAEGEKIIDNGNGSFAWSGPTGSRYISSGGYASSFYWTYNSTGSPTNSGKWIANLGEAGNYEVFAYIPADHATTANARYRIFHYGERVDRVINQSLYPDEWVSLGTYYFGGGGDESVSLYDNTGEAAGSTEVAFDAIKFVKR